MAKLARAVALGLVSASLRLDDISEKAYTLDEFEEIIENRVMLKLGEECSELSQAILKAVNPGSGKYKDLGDVMAEAGHVMLFLNILNTLTDGKPTMYRNRRIKRHLDSPKCLGKDFTTLLKSQIPEILSWTEKE